MHKMRLHLVAPPFLFLGLTGPTLAQVEGDFKVTQAAQCPTVMGDHVEAYRVYVVSKMDNFISVLDLQCESDADAIEQAKKFLV